MAQDDDTENIEGDEKKNWLNRKWLILAGLGVLLVVVSVGGTLLTMNFVASAREKALQVVEEPKPTKMPAIYYPIKPPIVVNFSVRGRQRFLQVELTVMTRDGSVVSAIELHQPMLRNALVLLYSGQDFAELQTAEGKELLRQATLQELQRLLEKEIGRPGIEQALFTNFVMQ